MITEKDTIRCEAIFDDTHTHRFSWKRVWNKDKPLAAVVMLNPAQSDNYVTDNTTALVINNIARLESFGGVVIVNLYSMLTNKLNFRWHSDEDLNAPENDHYIKKAADECETVILAWGKAADTNQRIAARVSQVLSILRDYQEKLFVISDGTRSGLHPLTPSLRSHWSLEAFQIPEKPVNQEESATE